MEKDTKDFFESLLKEMSEMPIEKLKAAYVPSSNTECSDFICTILPTPTNYTIIKGESSMKHITILTSAEIETLIYGCMAAISHYCHEENEALPYQELIRKLEALQQTDNTYLKGNIANE